MLWPHILPWHTYSAIIRRLNSATGCRKECSSLRTLDSAFMPGKGGGEKGRERSGRRGEKRREGEERVGGKCKRGGGRSKTICRHKLL